jgi:hypothetical protein
MAISFERRCDVFHTEGLDAEERTEAESFVGGGRTEQEHPHQVECPAA